MPLELPNLDDRTYTDLVAEALSLIPTYAPEWTNHNPSEPGITLIELFAYLTEMLIYRLNQVTDENIYSFLKLLNGPDWQPSGSDIASLEQDIQTTIRTLRQQERAVSCQDFETLALAADSRVARVLCLPRRDLRMDFETERAGHVGIIILPDPELPKAELDELCEKIKNDFLEPRRLLTTRLHVVGPQYLPVDIKVKIVLLPDYKAMEVETSVKQTLEKFFSPQGNEINKAGWPFGRNIYVSEIHEISDRLVGVDYVRSVDLLTVKANRRLENGDKNSSLTGIELKDYELVQANISVQATR